MRKCTVFNALSFVGNERLLLQELFAKKLDFLLLVLSEGVLLLQIAVHKGHEAIGRKNLVVVHVRVLGVHERVGALERFVQVQGVAESPLGYSQDAHGGAGLVERLFDVGLDVVPSGCGGEVADEGQFLHGLFELAFCAFEEVQVARFALGQVVQVGQVAVVAEDGLVVEDLLDVLDAVQAVHAVDAVDGRVVGVVVVVIVGHAAVVVVVAVEGVRQVLEAGVVRVHDAPAPDRERARVAVLGRGLGVGGRELALLVLRARLCRRATLVSFCKC